jgi:hypothetical protein
MMKKSSLVVLAAVSLISAGSAFGAASGTVCGGTTAGPGQTIGEATATGEFVRQNFATRCSANVFLSYSQNAINFGVGAGSQKGKTAFAGNTGGGAVARSADCDPNTGCNAGHATTAATAALAAAGSS